MGKARHGESLGRVGVSSQEKAAALAPPPRRFWLWLEMLWTAVQPVVPWAQAGYRMARHSRVTVRSRENPAGLHSGMLLEYVF